jgi:hypothetical protein
MTRPALALVIAASALAGCDAATSRATLDGISLADVSANIGRASEESFRELPFTRGPVAVVAAEGGDLRTYRLYPCGGGTTACFGAPDGPASAIRRSNAHFIVAAPGGRTFFLRPGGGGTLRTPGGDVPLSWNSNINGVPAWPAPVFPVTPWFTQVPPGPAP